MNNTQFASIFTASNGESVVVSSLFSYQQCSSNTGANKIINEYVKNAEFQAVRFEVQRESV